MAYLLGEIFGGMLAMFLLGSLFEWALFKRVFDDPIKGKLASVVAGYLVGSSIAGFGKADGGPYYWPAFFDYAIPAVVVGCFAYVSGKRLKEKIGADGAREVFE
jgi:hypothetical protein